jgi:hypothetical protein
VRKKSVCSIRFRFTVLILMYYCFCSDSTCSRKLKTRVISKVYKKTSEPVEVLNSNNRLPAPDHGVSFPSAPYTSAGTAKSQLLVPVQNPRRHARCTIAPCSARQIPAPFQVAQQDPIRGILNVEHAPALVAALLKYSVPPHSPLTSHEGNDGG